MKRRDCLGSNTHLIKGFYSESLKNKEMLSEYSFISAAVVLIDCDLYEATLDVLDFIYDKLQVGTVVLFDDWNCFDADDKKGERRAVSEFLSKYSSFKFENIGNYGWHGTSFVVKAI